MNFNWITGVAALLAVSACTVAPQQNSLDTHVHLPLTYEQWHTNHYTTRDGLNVCSISSGYNGLIVTVGKMPGGLDVLIESNRTMHPGSSLTVSVGGTNFETYDSFFHAKESRTLVDAMAQGDKAYLEWSEINGPVGGQRSHVQNIIRLDDFKKGYKECRDSLKV